MATPDPAEHHEPIKIFINGTAHEVPEELLTYADVVKLEYGDNPPSGPGVLITITFKHAEKPHQGSLVAGGHVEVKQGTRFDVRVTDKS
jgi:Multiubiquitin